MFLQLDLTQRLKSSAIAVAVAETLTILGCFYLSAVNPCMEV